MPASTLSTQQVAIRVANETVALADEIVELIAASTPIRPTRTHVMRTALERGLAAMRAELDAPKGKRSK